MLGLAHHALAHLAQNGVAGDVPMPDQGLQMRRGLRVHGRAPSFAEGQGPELHLDALEELIGLGIPHGFVP